MSDDRLFDLLKTKLLIPLLQDAAEIEQQVMVQYLYAAYSLKKFPDATCTPAEFEYVRRWGTVLLAVARSEMEHLALVNGMLSAIGADPFFERQNIPVQFHYYEGENLARARDGQEGQENTPCNIRFQFERFNLPTIERFVCIESPSRETLEKEKMRIPEWCFSCGEDAAATFRVRGTQDYPSAGSRVPDHVWAEAEQALAPKGLLQAAPGFLRPGSIQQLYDVIEWLFKFLNRWDNLFTGNPNRQVFVPVEYQVNIFPITDLSSALSAIRLITEEGEGMDAPPDYQSHFTRFFTMRDELEELLDKAARENRTFEPALPLPLNPSLDKVTEQFARDLFELFNYTYATLLFLLTALYRKYVPQPSQSYPYFSSALQENAFGPMMTMLIRPMAEILAYARSGDGEHTTGPDYRISDADLELLGPAGKEKLANIEFFLGRFDEIALRLGRLSGIDGQDLFQVAREEGDLPFLRRQLAFVRESAVAMANNTRRIYQLGQLPQFVVNP